MLAHLGSFVHMKNERSEVSESSAKRKVSSESQKLLWRQREPVVWFWGRQFLVPKQPAVCVRGVDDVEVTPDKRPRGGSQRSGRRLEPRLLVFASWKGHSETTAQ